MLLAEALPEGFGGSAIKVGRCVRFAITDLDAFIATNRVAAIRQAHRCRTWP
jgi:hypothetical protein